MLPQVAEAMLSASKIIGQFLALFGSRDGTRLSMRYRSALSGQPASSMVHRRFRHQKSWATADRHAGISSHQLLQRASSQVSSVQRQWRKSCCQGSNARARTCVQHSLGTATDFTVATCITSIGIGTTVGNASGTVPRKYHSGQLHVDDRRRSDDRSMY